MRVRARMCGRRAAEKRWKKRKNRVQKHGVKLNFLTHFNFLIHYDRPYCGLSDKN